MRTIGPPESLGGDPLEQRWEAFADATKPLLDFANRGRALPPRFYEMIAVEYRQMVEDGEPHPVKRLGERHHATISAASRWVKEARRRELLPPKQRRQQ
jgi:hypothetical protein